MNDKMQQTPPPNLNSPGVRFVLKLPFYVKIGFGLLVLFGMVGSCAGHREGSIVVFVITAVVWTLMRIVAEAFQAVQVLRIANAQIEHAMKNQVSNKDDNDGPPPDPPTAPA